MQPLVHAMQVIRLQFQVHCIGRILIADAVARERYLRYVGTRESMVCGGCAAGSKQGKIAYGTKGSGLSISSVSIISPMI